MIIIKGKERKKETRTSNCQSFRKRFLKISGGLWEAVGSTASTGFSSEEAQSAPPSTAPHSWQWAVPRLHKTVFHEIQLLICFGTKAANMCLGIFSTVFSQKVLAHHSSRSSLDMFSIQDWMKAELCSAGSATSATFWASVWGRGGIK